MLASEDTKEGLTAFIEKRAANWKGQVALQPGRDDDLAGSDPRPFVEVLRLAITG